MPAWRQLVSTACLARSLCPPASAFACLGLLGLSLVAHLFPSQTAHFTPIPPTHAGAEPVVAVPSAIATPWLPAVFLSLSTSVSFLEYSR